jgi:hypothetical protein
MKEKISRTERKLTQIVHYSAQEIADAHQAAWDGLLIVRVEYSKDELERLAENDKYVLVLELPVWV